MTKEVKNLEKKKNQNAIVPAVSIEERKKEFLECLKDYMGLTSLALEKCGISHSQYRDWILEDKCFNLSLREAEEYAGDKVEGMLFKKIKEGDTQAIIFYCENKLRGRGYFKKS